MVNGHVFAYSRYVGCKNGLRHQCRTLEPCGVCNRNAKERYLEIPLSIRAAETNEKGKSIYAYDPKGIAAKAYEAFTKEVQDIGEKQRKRQHQTGLSR